MPLERRVHDYIVRHQLFESGTKVVVGVSGGPDSLCLLHFLRSMPAARLSPGALIVAHLNHRLRGGESEADAEFVRRLAGEWGLPVMVEAADVRALARERRLSIEEAARQARYAFLARAAVAAGANTLAVAHNADDQAETVLMHVLRGSGVAGLRGMRPKTEMAISDWGITNHHLPHLQLVRPLLDISRADIESYCAEHGLEPRLDASNLDTTLFRNRLRHEVLPLLENASPGLRARLRRMAEVMAGEQEILDRALAGAWALTVLEAGPDLITLDLAAFGSLATGAQRALVREAVARLRANLRDIDFSPVEAAVRLAAEGRTGARAPLPGGLSLRLGHSTLTLTPESAPEALPEIPLLAPKAVLSLSIPGVTPLPDSRWRLEAEVLRAGTWTWDQVQDNEDTWQAFVGWDALRGRGPFSLRTRRPGDRFQPQGMRGIATKLSDFMTGQKVPLGWRDRLPLVISNDEIAWVCGWRVSEPAAVKVDTVEVLRLRFV